MSIERGVSTRLNPRYSAKAAWPGDDWKCAARSSQVGEDNTTHARRMAYWRWQSVAHKCAQVTHDAVFMAGQPGVAMPTNGRKDGSRPMPPAGFEPATGRL